MSMKSLLALSALLLSASPATADDFLYLRCKQSVNLVTTNSITSKIIEDRTLDDVSILKIDFIKKSILDTRSAGPLSFTVQNNVMNVLTKSDDDELKINDVFKLNLFPPYLNSSRGTIVFKTKNKTNAHSANGFCKEVDGSVFEKALKESES